MDSRKSDRHSTAQIDMRTLLSEVRKIVRHELRTHLNTLASPTPNILTTETQGYVSRQELMRLLSISASTLADWQKRGYIRAHRIRRRVYYDLNEVKTVLAKSPNFEWAITKQL